MPGTGVNRRNKGVLQGLTLAAAAGVAALSILTVGPVGPLSAQTVVSTDNPSGAIGLRRLNEAQYGRSIEQVFGSGITIPGRFEPSLREKGLLAIGEAHVTVTGSGFEQNELRARQIAAQAFKEKRVAFACDDASSAFDDACAQTFIRDLGRQLYRRPLTEAEVASIAALARTAAGKSGSMARGLQAALERILVSPNFIFRIERTVADPAAPGGRRLDDYSLATRISFLLWDAPPDKALLDAVARGDLRDPVKTGRLIDAMLASPRFEQGTRAFFSDMFGYDQFQGLAKDQAIYPKFNSSLARDAQEQSLRTIVDLLLTNRGDYRDLFTTRKTFVTRSLGALYRVPVPATAFDGWAPYTFPASEPRSGILSLAGFLMLDPTHEGRSSPTIRGKSVRELLLCQLVPQPPANVNFQLVQDVANPLYRTARQRLTVHQESPACAGCHKLTDPIGLSLENYDAVGNYRTHENSALIDASGTFEGKPYVGLLGLAGRLRESEAVPSCLVRRAFEYSVGREAAEADTAVLEQSAARFASGGYRFPALMKSLAMSDAICAVALLSPVRTTYKNAGQAEGKSR
ncbi:DUF1592 domain-containing protein [Novosphingobium sp.]|uniref:DUF1592 domain-containing protein n=1 Tax=Novosphingobium sp. TaxID=1874826 RepID=UPI00286DE508|nr:DUF1592 domain-containing protein [Novosphingobium sp.]